MESAKVACHLRQSMLPMLMIIKIVTKIGFQECRWDKFRAKNSQNNDIYNKILLTKKYKPTVGRNFKQRHIKYHKCAAVFRSIK